VPGGSRLSRRPWPGSLRLAAQDVALSRRKQGFESPRERQLNQSLISSVSTRVQYWSNKRTWTTLDAYRRSRRRHTLDQLSRNVKTDFIFVSEGNLFPVASFLFFQKARMNEGGMLFFKLLRAVKTTSYLSVGPSFRRYRGKVAPRIVVVDHRGPGKRLMAFGSDVDVGVAPRLTTANSN
jgi:hypothetical protein